MPQSRLNALESLQKTGLRVVFVTPTTLPRYILPDAPLHRGFEKLSCIHKADYLRTYFMHFYGGGYSDIKFSSLSWKDCFQKLQDSDKYICGYREIGPRGVARSNNCLAYLKLVANWRHLLGNCAYICKPRTPFTQIWYGSMLAEMDFLEDSLLANPAEHPEDYLGRIPRVGSSRPSSYPIKWTQLLGSIFHPLCYKFRDRLMYDLPVPNFQISVDS